MKWSYLCLSFLISFSSCSKKENKKSTLDSRTEEITKEMTVIQKQLEIVQEKTRDDKYNILMDSRMGLHSKITASNDIMEIMNDLMTIDPIKSELIYEDMAEEFSLRLRDIHSQIKFKNLNPLKDNGHFGNSFYAVAATLNGSMSELIKRALKKDKTGKELNHAESVIVLHENKEMMTDLLEAKVDILSAFALQNLTDKKKMNFWQRTKSFAFTISFGLVGAIDYPETYAEANEATKNKIEDHLSKAVDAKKLLVEIGVNKKLSKRMNSAFKEISFGEKKKKKDETAEEKEIDARKELIKGLINQLVNN